MTEHWIGVAEIAVHLGISKETVYRWVKVGDIPAHRVGKLWKFKASEVDRWIKMEPWLKNLERAAAR